MGALGLNTAGRGEYSADELLDAGAAWTRCMTYPDTDINQWLGRARLLGQQPIMIMGSETLSDDENNWRPGLQQSAQRYGQRGVLFQIGNEPDASPNSPSSWRMHTDRYQRLWNAARDVLNGERLVSAGFCSGQPNWLDHLDLSGAYAICYHPYGKHPYNHGWGTGYLPELHAAYAGKAAAYGAKLIISEVGWQTGDGGMSESEQADYYGALAQWGRDQSDLEALLIFCYSDGMVDGFGLRRRGGSKKPSFEAFRQYAAGVPIPMPPQTPTYYVGPGVQAALDKNGWIAEGPEKYFSDSASMTPTDAGALFYLKESGKLKLMPWQDVAA